MRVKAFKSVVRANLEFYEVANDDQEKIDRKRKEESNTSAKESQKGAWLTSLENSKIKWSTICTLFQLEHDNMYQ